MQNTCMTKVLYLEYIQNSYILRIRGELNNTKMREDLHRHVTKGDTLEAKQDVKTTSTSLVRESYIKITITLYYSLTIMAKIQKINHGKCYQECRTTGTVTSCCWDNKLARSFGQLDRL